jgi:mannose-6-phosphate isomerase-like protein (cupin superfamily)
MSTGSDNAGHSDEQAVFVADLRSVEPQEWYDRAVGVATVHGTDAAGFAVQVIAAGQELLAHHHEGMWDHFVGLSGSATLHLSTPEGRRSEYRLSAGSFLAVPPGVTHRVDNTTGREPFGYLLVQAPYVDGDFHADEPATETEH